MRWMLNCLYLLFGLLALPYWLWKLPRARRYRAGIVQRLGFAPRMAKGTRRLWVHAASVGEASIPKTLLQKFRDAYRGWQIVFSTSTDTGADRLRELYPGAPVFFWPLDFSCCVARALERVAPDAIMLVELEVWPNFMEACRRRAIPVAIVNGRISKLSSRLLRALSRLCRRLWEPVRVCCARSTQDARLFRQAGLPQDRIHCCGSLKYDALPLEADHEKEAALRQLFGLDAGAPVLVAGSTHPGEEEILCRVYRGLKGKHQGLRLIIVPRHIERAEALARQIRSLGLPVIRKTALDAGRACPEGEEIILVDTIGDLPACYALASCVFVGRSLVKPGGGQNMMEPAALAKPVIVGPHTGNFRPEMAMLGRNGSVLVVSDGRDLEMQCDRLLSDRQAARSLGERARARIVQSQGATEKSFARVQHMLEAISR